jgi:hypothetical protein
MKNFFTPLILGLLLSSCVYEPDGWYDAPVHPASEAPAVQVVELGLEADTVFVYGTRTIHFSFDAGRSDVLMVKLLVDGEVVDSVAEGTGVLQYVVYGNRPTPSLHELELQVFVTSGTGSIADKLLVEGFLLSQKWVMVYNKYMSANLQSTIDNGNLLLSWDAYRSADFKAYEVVRGSYEYFKVAETITTNYLDQSYVGEGGTFRVNVITLDGKRRSWGELTLPGIISAPRLKAIGENSYVIYWSPTPFYKAFKAYHLTIDYNEKHTFTSVNDTLIASTAKFGKRLDLSLMVQPVDGNVMYNASNPYSFRVNDDSYAGIEISIAHPAHEFTQINPGELAINDGRYMRVYSPSARGFIREVALRTDDQNAYGRLSPRGKYFLGYTNNEAPFNPQYFSTNLETGTTLSQPALKSVMNNQMHLSAIADNGMGLVIGSNFEAGFNFNTATRTYYQYSGANLNSVRLSSDGKYSLTIFDSIYLRRIEAQRSIRVASIGSYSYSERDIEFNPLNSNELVMTADRKLMVYQCEPFKSVHKFDLQANESMLFIDFFRREVLTGMPRKLYIRKLDDWTLLKEIEVEDTPSYSSNIVLCDRYVILRNSLMSRFEY